MLAMASQKRPMFAEDLEMRVLWFDERELHTSSTNPLGKAVEWDVANIQQIRIHPQAERADRELLRLRDDVASASTRSTPLQHVGPVRVQPSGAWCAASVSNSASSSGLETFARCRGPHSVGTAPRRRIRRGSAVRRQTDHRGGTARPASAKRLNPSRFGPTGR